MSVISSARKESKSNLYVVKQKLQKLFLNYCDFNQKAAIPYITQSTFVKIVRESGVNISEGALGVMMGSALQIK